MIKFGVIDRIEANGRLLRRQAQQKPDLFLPDATRRGSLALVTVRQAVAQPAARGPDQLHVADPEADLLMQLAIKRLFRGFAHIDTALRELPSAVPGTACPQHLAVVAGHYDAHIGPEPFGVDGLGDSFHGAFNPRVHYRAVYGISDAANPKNPGHVPLRA